MPRFTSDAQVSSYLMIIKVRMYEKVFGTLFLGAGNFDLPCVMAPHESGHFESMRTFGLADLLAQVARRRVRAKRRGFIWGWGGSRWSRWS